MPFKYEKDDARRRVVVTVSGRFEAGDAVKCVQRYRDDDGARRYGLLYDLRGMNREAKPSISDLRLIMTAGTEPRGEIQARAPIAILVTDPAMYNAACAYGAMTESKLRIEVFRDIDEAHKWLANQTDPPQNASRQDF